MRTDWKRPDEWDSPGQGEKRIMMFVSYDGSFYHGWQSQNNSESVQDAISGALSAVLKKDTKVFGSGRTDAGVHAVSQCCHFDTDSSIEPELFRVILNTALPKSIRINESREAPEGFHARFSTMSREYWYLVKEAESMLPFDFSRVLQWTDSIDIDALSSYSKNLFGTHDFTTFASSVDKSESKTRDIYVSEWDEFHDSFGKRVFRYRVAGNAFLYRQVRSMVGTMLECMKRGESAEEFKKRLDSRDRGLALKTAPPDGLYLADVSYDGAKYEWFEEKNGKK